MPGFTDLLDLHAEYDVRFVAAQTVRRELFFPDKTGAPIDFTGVEAVCEIVDYADYDEVVLPLDVALGAEGLIVISKAAAAFPVALGGGRVGGVRYRWRLTLSKESTGESVSLWSPDQSTVTIVPA